MGGEKERVRTVIFNVVLLLPCFLIRYFAAVIYSGKSFFLLLLLFVRKKMGFIECLFLILVGCCLRKVGGLAASVPGEF